MEKSERSDLALPGGTGRCAAILLTGGTSRRMGRDKATMALGAHTGGLTLAERTAGLLAAVASPLVEVGPGHSGLWAIREDPPGRGPLAGAAAGWQALADRGWDGPVLLVATDLPRLGTAILRWLAGHPADRAVVPVSGDRVQPLCARYRSVDLDRAVELVAAGERSMAALLDAVDPVLVPEPEWRVPAGDPRALDDVDTPDDLSRVTGQ